MDKILLIYLAGINVITFAAGVPLMMILQGFGVFLWKTISGFCSYCIYDSADNRARGYSWECEKQEERIDNGKDAK